MPRATATPVVLSAYKLISLEQRNHENCSNTVMIWERAALRHFPNCSISEHIVLTNGSSFNEQVVVGLQFNLVCWTPAVKVGS